MFGDLCVPVYCFCSGYAQSLLSDKEGERYARSRFQRIWKFLTHFWLIVALFSCIGLIVGDASIPGSLSVFLGNMLLYRLSYNGAWWFVVTYLFLVLLTPLAYRLVRKMNGWLLLLTSGAVYFAAYVFRFAYVLNIENPVLSWIWNQTILLGTSQFSFVVGMLFYRYDVIGWLRRRLDGKWWRAPMIAGLPVLMLLGHGVVQSLVVAPITGLVTLTCFHLWEKPRWVEVAFLFMGRHSTNIWLTHMFFYLVLFPELVFRAKYPPFIFLCMIVLCILVSYGIDGMEKGLRYLYKTLFKQICQHEAW